MYFFDLVFLIDCVDYFLAYGNVNFYIYIAIQFLFSLYVVLFIYFWNYFDCGALEGLDTQVIYT